MSTSSSSASPSRRQYDRAPLRFPLVPEDYAPHPKMCLCQNKKESVQYLSWSKDNPMIRFTVCPLRFKSTDACRLYEFNDNHLSEFQKIIVARLKEKIRDLENDVTAKDLLLDKLKEKIRDLENDVTAKDLLLDKLQREVTAKDLLLDKLQKEQEGKEIEVKISRFGKLQEKRSEGAEINTSMNKKLDKFTGLRPENYSAPIPSHGYLGMQHHLAAYPAPIPSHGYHPFPGYYPAPIHSHDSLGMPRPFPPYPPYPAASHGSGTMAYPEGFGACEDTDCEDLVGHYEKLSLAGERAEDVGSAHIGRGF